MKLSKKGFMFWTFLSEDPSVKVRILTNSRRALLPSVKSVGFSFRIIERSLCASLPVMNKPQGLRPNFIGPVVSDTGGFGGGLLLIDLLGGGGWVTFGMTNSIA